MSSPEEALEAFEEMSQSSPGRWVWQNLRGKSLGPVFGKPSQLTPGGTTASIKPYDKMTYSRVKRFLDEIPNYKELSQKYREYKMGVKEQGEGATSGEPFTIEEIKKFQTKLEDEMNERKKVLEELRKMFKQIPKKDMEKNDTISVRETKNYVRKRQFEPSECEEGTFRTFEIGKGKKAIGCKKSSSGKFEVQAILEPKSKDNDFEEGTIYEIAMDFYIYHNNQFILLKKTGNVEDLLEQIQTITNDTKQEDSTDEKWMQKAVKRPGALHEKLGIPKDQKIPMSLIESEISKLRKKGEGDKKLSEEDRRYLQELIYAKNAKKTSSKDLVKTQPNMRNDLITTDFVRVNDSTLSGYIVRSGPYLYPDGVKYKDGQNLKETYENIQHAIAYGSKVQDSHTERDDRFIGYFDNFKYFPMGAPGVYGENDIDDKYDRIHAELHTSKDISELSDLEEFIGLPVSASYEDLGSGNQQKIGRIHHIAVSLNANEQDRCSTLGGTPCNVSLAINKDLVQSMNQEEGVLRADFSQPPLIKNKETITMAEKKEEVKDKEDMDNSYDEKDEKEMSVRKKKEGDSEMTEDKTSKKDMEPKMDMSEISKLIAQEVSKITADMSKELEVLKAQEIVRQNKKANDLRDVLSKEPYGFTEDFMKDLSLEELQEKKDLIENTKIFKDYIENLNSKTSIENNSIASQDINKKLFDETKVKDFIAERAKHSADLWGVYHT